MLAGGLLACLGGAALAAPVKGKVALSPDLKAGRRYRGYWRVENGIVPVTPASTSGETVVVLQGFKGQMPPPKTVTIELANLAPNPPMVVIGEGSVIEFKNSDKVPHDLSTIDQPSLMPLERLMPDKIRRQRFSEAGAYLIRCAEYPHVAISIVVVNTPFVVATDDKGLFKLPDVPDGKGTLRVWSHGRWVHEEPIEIAGKPVDVNVKLAGSAKDAE